MLGPHDTRSYRPFRSPQESEYREPNPSNKLRVGFICCSLYVGGAERWMISLAKSTPRLKWIGCANVGVNGWIYPSIVGELSSLMPIYSHLGDGRPEGCMGLSARLDTTRAAVEAVSRRADVLIVWGVPMLHAHLSKEYDGKVVLTCHGAGDEWSRHVIDNSAIDSTDFVAVSEAALTPFGRLASRATVIENGAEIARCKATLGREEARERFGWSRDDIVVGYLGRFSGEKRPDYVANVVMELRSRAGTDRFKCWYVGTGARFITESLEQLASAAPLGTIRFKPPISHVGDALKAMDCLLLPSVSEGFSLATVEAWIAKVPVVTVDSGVASTANRKYGRCAIVFSPAAKINEIANAVEIAIGPESKAIVDNANRIALEHYSAEAMGRRWEQYLYAINGLTPIQ